MKMILGSKHVGAILNVLIKKNYVCALVCVLIKCLYEIHGATIKILPIVSACSFEAMRNEITLVHLCGFRCYNSTTEKILYIRLLQKHEIQMQH